LYACTIKETTNGGWRRARRETRKAFEEIAQRRFKTNGKLDERKTIARVRENKAQKVADKKEEKALSGGFFDDNRDQNYFQIDDCASVPAQWILSSARDADRS
jgi:hypothetical protein